jgi:hypothetical protein
MLDASGAGAATFKMRLMVRTLKMAAIKMGRALRPGPISYALIRLGMQ